MPAAGAAEADWGRRFPMEATTAFKRAEDVYRKRCTQVAPSTWDISFQVRLRSGERTPQRIAMFVSNTPYVGILRSPMGGRYLVSESFYRTCR